MASQVVSPTSCAIRPNYQRHDRRRFGGELAVAQGDPEDEEISEVDGEEMDCPPCTEERTSRGLQDPLQPTQRQIDDHDRTHLPFRNWCPWCVKAKAREAAHPRQGVEEAGLPVIGMDYIYYGNDSKKDEEDTDRKITALLVKDAKSGVMFGETCVQKGANDDWIIRRRAIASAGAIESCDGEDRADDTQQPSCVQPRGC